MFYDYMIDRGYQKLLNPWHECFGILRCYPILLVLGFIHVLLRGSAEKCCFRENIQLIFRIIISLLLVPISICCICINFFLVFPIVGLGMLIVLAYQLFSGLFGRQSDDSVCVTFMAMMAFLAMIPMGLILLGIFIFCVSFVKAIIYTVQYHLIFASDEDSGFIVDDALEGSCIHISLIDSVLGGLP